MPSRRAFLALGGSFALSACGNLLGPGEAARIHSLPATPPPPQPGPKAAFALTVMRPDANAMLDSERIALSRADGTMDYYAQAQYPDRLPVLVEAALVEAFESSGRVDAVAREGDGLSADVLLITEIKHFEARYAVPDGIPAAHVALTLKLASARGRKVLASMTADRTVPATANSAGAAAAALGAALSAALADIVPWALAVPVPPQPAR